MKFTTCLDWAEIWHECDEWSREMWCHRGRDPTVSERRAWLRQRIDASLIRMWCKADAHLATADPPGAVE